MTTAADGSMSVWKSIERADYSLMACRTNFINDAAADRSATVRRSIEVARRIANQVSDGGLHHRDRC